MNAELMNRLKTAVDVQAMARKARDAAVDYELAIETCVQKAMDASAWCPGEECADLAEVSETLGGRMTDARDCARDVYRAAVCIADGVIGEAMKGMTDRERLEAWGVLIHGAVPEVDVMDSDGRMLAKGRSVCRCRSRRRKGLSASAEGCVHG